MAQKPTKKTSPSTKKKKASVSNKTVKGKRTSKNTSHMKTNVLTVLGVFLMITFVVFGYYLGQVNQKDLPKAIESGELEGEYTTKQLLDELSKTKQEQLKRIEEQKAKEKVDRTPPPKKLPPKKAVEKKREPLRAKIKPLLKSDSRPRLVIVIDDVSKQSQLNAIKETGLKLTPSIFPPSELSMTSNQLAKGLKHYMIHLPMESGSVQFNKQYKTLLTSFTQKQIEIRAQELRNLFPSARYINNHTGSTFTANYDAMHQLYRALRDEGFVFIDSRTIGSSKVKKIAKEFGDAYVARDIFIDNMHTIPYIHKQLELAVQTAKKRGYAIAIGHPHRVTMQALKSATDILKDVDLIYIDTLYEK